MASIDVCWMALFADVPAQTHERAVAYWEAITAARVGEPFGERREHHPLLPPDGDRYVWLQRIDQGEPRWHLDLYVRDRAPAVEAATALGARVKWIHEWWTACESPGGQPFCFVRESPTSRRRPPAANWPGGRSEVDQICIDIPHAAFEPEVKFWTTLTGWAPLEGDLPEFERVDVPGSLPLWILLQRLGSDEAGPVRAHADLSADDRAAEVRRHVELGATLVHEAEHWTVLRDPVGLTYCVTDRSPHR